MIRKILSLTVLFFLTSYTLAEPLRYCTAQENSQDPEISYEEAIRRLDLFMQKIEELRSHIDRSQFDLEALLDKIGYEAEDIIRFVKEEIAFEQYPGLLRGAQGTLMSRAGNALDQSVLLATLLKDAGYEARIAQARLVDGQATELLRNLKNPDNTPPFPRSQELRSLLSSAFELNPSELEVLLDPTHKANALPSSTRPELNLTVNRHSDLILHQLLRHGIELTDRGLSQRLEDEAADYFWVQFRTGSENWSNVHPSLIRTTKSFVDIEPEKFYSESIPPELQHRIRFQSFLVQKRGDTTNRRALMSPWERPAANLLGIPLRYTTFPSGFGTLESFTPEEVQLAIDKSRLFFPLLNDNLTEGAYAFNSLGITVPPGEGLSHMAGLFDELSVKLEKASKFLSALNQPSERVEDAFAIRKHEVELTLIAPGGDEKILIRELAGPTEFSQLKKDALGVQATFTVFPGSVPPSFTIDNVLGQLISLRPILGRLQAQSYGISAASAGAQSSHRSFAPPPHIIEELLHLHFVDSGARVYSGADITYRSEPAIFGRYSHFWLFGKPVGGFDVLHNARRAFSSHSDGIRLDPLALMRIGIWETLVESLLQRKGPFDSYDTFNAFQGKLIPAQTVFLKEVPSSSLELYDVPTGISIEQDLRNGYVVILPKPDEHDREGADQSKTGWWRVDPITGETLGRISQGWGGVVFEIPAEYLTTKIKALMAANSVRATGAWLRCETAYVTFLKVIAGIAVGQTFLEAIEEIFGETLPVWLKLLFRAMAIASVYSGIVGWDKVRFMTTCIPLAYMIPGP